MRAKRAFYDDPEFDYEKYWRKRSYEDRAEKIALEKFFSRLSAAGEQVSRFKLLDAGAGFGRLAEIYLPMVGKAVLLEPSAKVAAIGRRRLGAYLNFSYKKGFIEDLSSGDGPFDIAIMIRVMHHLEDHRRALKSIYRLLSPRGWFVLEVPNKFNFKHNLNSLIHGRINRGHNRIDRRSADRKKETVIPFYNYSPENVKKEMEEMGFAMVEKLSVSNFRWPLLKRFIPARKLLWLERRCQRPFSLVNFGPSIFFLLRKE